MCIALSCQHLNRMLCNFDELEITASQLAEGASMSTIQNALLRASEGLPRALCTQNLAVNMPFPALEQYCRIRGRRPKGSL